MNFLDGVPKEKKQQVILAGLMSVTAIIGLNMFFVGKQITKIKANNEQIAKFTTKIQDTQETLEKALLDQSFHQITTEFMDNQLKTMVAGDPFSWTVRELSLLAEQHPIQIVSLRPGKLGKHSRKSTYEVFTTSIELFASYDELGQFLQSVENRFPTAEFTSVEVSGGGTEDRPLKASLQLVILVQPEVEAIKVIAKKEGTGEPT